MIGTCSTHGGNEKRVHNFRWSPKTEKTTSETLLVRG